MRSGIAGLPWSILAPVALIVGVVLAVLWLDVTTGGEAEPPPLLGALGTPVRGTFVAPTATPIGAGPTPRPRPTISVGVIGTPATRDEKRRTDAFAVLIGLQQLRDRDGAFPSTGGNIQSLCVYKEIDQGCKLDAVLGTDPPFDPLGDPVTNGYWYQSDGSSAKVYVSLEGEIDDAERCETDYIEFDDDPNMICPTIP